MSREIEHGVEQIDVAGSLGDLATGEHAALGGDHDVDRRLGHLSEASCVVDEARHVGRHEAVDHGASADGLASEDAGVDSRFGVVADDAADELHARVDALAVVFHRHGAVGVFQVAVGRACPEVDPTAQVAVAEKAVVLLVGVGFNDRAFDFAADFCRVAHGDAVLDGRVFDDACTGAEMGGAVQVAVGADTDVFFEHDRAVDRFEDHVLAKLQSRLGIHAWLDFVVSAGSQPVFEVGGQG